PSISISRASICPASPPKSPAPPAEPVACRGWPAIDPVSQRGPDTMSDSIIPVFDLGGVFIDWDPIYLFRKLFATEEEARWFQDHICTRDWNLDFDAGDIYAEGVAKLITRHPRYWREIQAYD